MLETESVKMKLLNPGVQVQFPYKARRARMEDKYSWFRFEL